MASVGNAATEYEAPTIDSGTLMRLYAKVKTAIDPAVSVDASIVSPRNVTWFIESAMARGIEIATVSMRAFHSRKLGNEQKKPSPITDGTWIPTCMTAPRTTPQASPAIPK